MVHRPYKRQPECDPEAFDRSCAGKEPYPTAAAAEQAAQLERQGRIKHFRRRGRMRGDLVPYECDFCGAWHLGH